MKRIPLLVVIVLFSTIIFDEGIETNTTVTFVYIVLVIIIISFFLSHLRSPEYKGRVGEKKVTKKLNNLDHNKYFPFHNITLSTPDGSTQIDHIVISQFGIFVIETKNLKGWIFGGASQKTWTQTLYSQKYKFQNPLYQNYKHVKAVQNHLGLNEKSIISIVVFVGNSDFMTEMPNNVLELRDLLYFIQSYSDENLSRDKVDQYIQKLKNFEETSFINCQEHINNIDENRNNPVCPKCGKSMVIRSARKGRNAGNDFWGCSGYPSCRFTRNMD